MKKDAMKKDTFASSLATYWRLLQYLKGLMWAFSLSIIGFMIFAASQPMMAKIMELIIEAIENKDTDARWSLPLLAVGVFLIRGIGMFLGTYYNDFIGASVVKTIKLRLFEHMVVLPAKYYDSVTQGHILHRLNTGVAQVQSAVTTGLKTLIREGLTIISLLAYVFYLNWKLSLIFLVVAPFLAFLVAYTSKKFRQIARKSEGATGLALQISKEMISNYGVVRGFGAEKYELDRYSKAVIRAFKSQLKIRRVQAIFSPLSQLIISIAVAFIIFLLLNPDVLATSSTGELVGYLTAVALIPKPLRQLSGVTVTIQRGVVGAEMVFELLDEQQEKDEGSYVAQEIEGWIRVEGLSFRYPKSESIIVNKISFCVKPGEMVALVGKSGSGKSTLSSLLYRFYEVDNGAIYIDDIDINNYKLSNLRRHVAVVNQNVALFDDTVRNNIAYGDAEFSDKDIYEALKNAHAQEFVDALPNGLDTTIGENGLKLSGGQRQRLAIARAFLKNAPILILDEATSSLDNEAEAVITKAIENLASTRTTIVIAHRLSTILRADRVLVMNEGEIVEEGVHQELIRRNGYYAHLVQAEYK